MAVQLRKRKTEKTVGAKNSKVLAEWNTRRRMRRSFFLPQWLARTFFVCKDFSAQHLSRIYFSNFFQTAFWDMSNRAMNVVSLFWIRKTALLLWLPGRNAKQYSQRNTSKKKVWPLLKWLAEPPPVSPLTCFSLHFVTENERVEMKLPWRNAAFLSSNFHLFQVVGCAKRASFALFQEISGSFEFRRLSAWISFQGCGHGERDLAKGGKRQRRLFRRFPQMLLPADSRSCLAIMRHLGSYD